MTSKSTGGLNLQQRAQLRTTGGCNRDNEYQIAIQASDGTNRGTLDVTITVTDVNEGPEVTGPDSFTIGENQELPGAAYTATDPEGSAITRWSLSGRDGGDFTITGTSNQTGLNTAVLAFRNPRTMTGPRTPTATTFTKLPSGPPTAETTATST